MDVKTVAEFMQEPLQEAFDAECRNYAIYLELYESLFETCKELEKQRDELEEEKDVIQKTEKMVQIFSSKDFDKISKLLNLSDSDVENFIKAISMYKADSNLESKLQEVECEINIYGKLLEILRDNLHFIEENTRKIVECVKDTQLELEFLEENPIAERLLVLLYYDGNYFANHRKVIKIEDCKFSDNFVKAYLAIEGEEKAYSWFVEEAKKYKI